MHKDVDAWAPAQTLLFLFYIMYGIAVINQANSSSDSSSDLSEFKHRKVEQGQKDCQEVSVLDIPMISEDTKAEQSNIVLEGHVHIPVELRFQSRRNIG